MGFDGLIGRARQASWLWIGSRRSAVAFLVALTLVAVPAIAFEASNPWRLLRYFEFARGAPDPVAVGVSLAEAVSSDADIVLFLGGSTGREFTASDAAMSAALTSACGRDIRFVNGATGAQRIATSWVLTDAVPAHKRALVLVGMNYHKLEEDTGDIAAYRDDVDVPLPPSPALDAYLAGDGITSRARPLSFHQTGWFLRNLGHLQYSGSVPTFEAWLERELQLEDNQFFWRRHKYELPAQSRERQIFITQRYIAWREATFRAKHAVGTKSWIAFARAFATGPSRVGFVVLPQNDVMQTVDRMVGPAFERDMAALEAAGFHVADWRDTGLLQPDDFYDQSHLVESGRRKMFEPLVELIASQIAGCAGSAPNT